MSKGEKRQGKGFSDEAQVDLGARGGVGVGVRVGNAIVKYRCCSFQEIRVILITGSYF